MLTLVRAALVVAALAFLGFRTFRRRRVQQDETGDVREAARDDLVALADDVRELEQRVAGNPAAKRDYEAALEQYSRASSSFDRARSAQQLAPVAKALEEGRYLMASAEARLEGLQPPERRPPCFFDPRHGPSVRDVEWAPPGGQPRLVPACAACALRVEEGEEPESRQVLVGGAMTPYWAAGPMFGGYFGGFFCGLFVPRKLGGFGGWAAPGAYGDPGGDFDAIQGRLQKAGAKVVAIVHTHTHIDHVGGIHELQERLAVPAAIHKADLFLYEKLDVQAQWCGMPVPKPAAIDRFVVDGDAVSCQEVEMGVIHTPGHTPGSTTFHLRGDRNILFTDDTLFMQSIGRTDLWGGSYEEILRSIEKKLMTFDDDTLVIPGHGQATTIGHEKRYNPFLR